MAVNVTVDAVVLAGGLGSRMAGRDKGLLRNGSIRFAEHLCAVLAPFCRQVIISCNRNEEQYAQFADITVCDQHPDYLGPLAGIQAAARQSDAQLLLITPCDTPNLDVRYPIRMLQDAATVAQTRIAYDGSRRQQLHLLIARQLALSIEPYLAAGERSVKGWLQPLDPLRIDFSDCAELFQNINTETEFSDWSMQQQKQQPS